jgi:GNAT superfamily N-acetyltransferase
MIVEAGPEDRPRLETLLTARLDQAMFPVSNLRAHGLRKGGHASDHPQATRFWLLDGQGVVALTEGGMVMALLPDGCDLASLPSVFAGLTVSGAAGPAQSIRPVLRVLGLHAVPTRLDADEPGFALALDDLQRPNLPGATLVPAASVPRDMLIDWRKASMIETQGMPPEEAPAKATKQVAAWLLADSHRVLLLGGRPVSLTGFNARLPKIVQVGGVYTPPDLRSRGYARTAVALHLSEARATGVPRAVLFAATPAAVRAYRALGFQPTADFALVLFRHPLTVPA